MDLELVIQTVSKPCNYIFFFFQAETIFLNQDLEEKNENQENDDEEEDKLFWLEACYKALTWHRKNKHVQVGFFCKLHSRSNCLFNNLFFDSFRFLLPLIQEAACWALNNLLMYQNSLHEKIGDEDGQSVVFILCDRKFQLYV